jgi:hypothetical protein
LARKGLQAPPTSAGGNLAGFPMFDVPPDAVRITDEMVRSAREDE